MKHLIRTFACAVVLQALGAHYFVPTASAQASVCDELQTVWARSVLSALPAGYSSQGLKPYFGGLFIGEGCFMKNTFFSDGQNVISVTLTVEITADPESAQNKLSRSLKNSLDNQNNPTDYKSVEQLQILQPLGDIGGYYVTEVTDQGKSNNTLFRTTKGHLVLRVDNSMSGQTGVQIGQRLIQALYDGENVSPSAALVEFPPQDEAQTAERKCPPGTRIDEGGVFGLGGWSCVAVGAGSAAVVGSPAPSAQPSTQPEIVSPAPGAVPPSDADDEESFVSADVNPNAGKLGEEEKFFAAPGAAGGDATANPVFEYIDRVVEAYVTSGVREIAPNFISASSCADCVPHMIYCRGEIDGVEGLNGKSVRASSNESRKLVQDMGGTVQLISFGDVRRAFELNMIDCSISGGGLPN